MEKCSVCGEEFVVGLDGVVKCKNGHEKKKQVSHYTYPLDEPSGSYYKKKPF